MLRMMDSERGFYGPINLGNPCEFTMLELAEKVLRSTGSKSRLVKSPFRPTTRGSASLTSRWRAHARLGAEGVSRRRTQRDRELFQEAARGVDAEDPTLIFGGGLGERPELVELAADPRIEQPPEVAW